MLQRTFYTGICMYVDLVMVCNEAGITFVFLLFLKTLIILLICDLEKLLAYPSPHGADVENIYCSYVIRNNIWQIQVHIQQMSITTTNLML